MKQVIIGPTHVEQGQHARPGGGGPSERVDFASYVFDELDRDEGLHGDAERRHIDVCVISTQVAIVVQAAQA